MAARTTAVAEVKKAAAKTVTVKTPDHGLLLKIHAAQQVIDNPKKTSSNPAFKGRNAKYAGLEATMDVVDAALAEVGLGHTVFFQGRNIVYRVFDLSNGAYLDSAAELPLDGLTGNVWQQMGQAFTYMRRYLAQAVFQLIPEDTDANDAPKRTAPARATTAGPKHTSPVETGMNEDVL
jgi:hypothetical protein